MPTVELRGLPALEAWGRKVTSGYRGVCVRDLSSSWRDGLAFCAIIHHFRAELIDFDSLSAENILYNNELAFTVGEKLGIPAILDPQDMLVGPEPDRNCIALYLSQVYECFEGSKKPNRRRSSAIFNRGYSTGSTVSGPNSTPATPTTPTPIKPVKF